MRRDEGNQSSWTGPTHAVAAPPAWARQPFSGGVGPPSATHKQGQQRQAQAPHLLSASAESCDQADGAK